jgi:GT2 family glycosyltransferase
MQISGPISPGVSVIIPERDNPVILKTCLQSLAQAMEKIQEPCQIIVVVNGAPEERYQQLSEMFPAIDWIFVEEPLGFSSAVELGLQKAIFEWVFLLNNDMRLEPDCLQQLMLYRADDVFSIASQIFFEDQTRRREETGLTGIRIEHDDVHLFDKDVDSAAVVDHFYSGGGASLFRKSLLNRYIRLAHSYDPFYWEDVDWGRRATLEKFLNLFVPSAKVWHLHRATVGRFYTPEQVNRIFERNKWIFYLRFGLRGMHPFWLGRKLRDSGCATGKVLRDLLFACAEIGAVSVNDNLNTEELIPESYFSLLPLCKPHLPWLLLVIPFALYPKAHGAAIRQQGIYRELANHFNIWLISDEGSEYGSLSWADESPFARISLLKTPRFEQDGSLRSERMKTHARAPLRKLILDAIERVSPKIIQIEHEELCELIDIRQKNVRWAITLHDVNVGIGEDAEVADARLLRALAGYDAIFTVSEEDSRLLPVANYCIENGVDPQKFHPISTSSGKRLVFVGPFRYAPNHEAIEFFINNLWQPLRDKYPDITLQILAGLDNSIAFAEAHPVFQQPGIELINATHRVNEYLNSSTVVINPLQGIRGSCLKTIEALASGRICISTRDAARGLESYGFNNLKIAENWADFMVLIQRYLDDDTLRAAEENPDVSKLQPFYWSARANQQLAVYQQLSNNEATIKQRLTGITTDR